MISRKKIKSKTKKKVDKSEVKSHNDQWMIDGQQEQQAASDFGKRILAEMEKGVTKTPDGL